MLPDYITKYPVTLFNELRKNAVWIVAVVIISIVISLLLGLSFAPIEVLDGGIHEFGHALAADLTGGSISSITIEANTSGSNMLGNNMLDLKMSRTYTNGGIPLIVFTGGVTFSLIISLLIAETRYLRWYAPILGMRNLLVILPIPSTETDGLQILTNYGSLVCAIVVLANIFLYILTVNRFIKGNFITRHIKSYREQNSSTNNEEAKHIG